MPIDGPAGAEVHDGGDPVGRLPMGRPVRVSEEEGHVVARVGSHRQEVEIDVQGAGSLTVRLVPIAAFPRLGRSGVGGGAASAEGAAREPAPTVEARGDTPPPVQPLPAPATGAASPATLVTPAQPPAPQGAPQGDRLLIGLGWATAAGATVAAAAAIYETLAWQDRRQQFNEPARDCGEDAPNQGAGIGSPRCSRRRSAPGTSRSSATPWPARSSPRRWSCS